MSLEDRVAELEATVTELRATVDGLTEELVETRERLRQQEAAPDGGSTAAPSTDASDASGDAAFVSPTGAESATPVDADASADPAGNGQASGAEGELTDETAGTEAAEPEPESGAGEGDDRTETTDHADPASEDDIIVA